MNINFVHHCDVPRNIPLKSYNTKYETLQSGDLVIVYSNANYPIALAKIVKVDFDNIYISENYVIRKFNKITHKRIRCPVPQNYDVAMMERFLNDFHTIQAITEEQVNDFNAVALKRNILTEINELLQNIILRNLIDKYTKDELTTIAIILKR